MVQVDVLPSKREDFTAAETSRHREQHGAGAP